MPSRQEVYPYPHWVHGANDRLSVIMSAIYKLQQHCSEEWAHLDDFGSDHECGGLVAKGQKRRAVELFDSFQLTPTEVYEAGVARTSVTYMYKFRGDVFDAAMKEFENREALHVKA